MNTFHKVIYHTKRWFGKNSGTIFTVLEVAGVIGVAVVTAQCATKAQSKLVEKAWDKVEEKEDGMEEYGENLTTKEIVKTVAPCYIPAIAVCAAEITLIVLSGHSNKKKIGGLAAALAITDQKYREYKDQVKETLGEETAEKVDDALFKKKVNEKPLINEDGKVLFLDEFSGRHFYAEKADVITACYEANRIFSQEGYLSLNAFYDLLNEYCDICLSHIEIGDYYGWDCSIMADFDGYYWIDYVIKEAKNENAEKYYVLQFYNCRPLDYEEAEKELEKYFMPVERQRYKETLEIMANK